MYIVLAAISYLGFGCTKNDTSFKVFYYQDNKTYNVNLDKKSMEEVYNLFKELAYNTDDMLKLIVTSSRIEELKKKESLIEVVFNDFIYFDSKVFGKIKAKKVLIPLSGDFIGSGTSSMITIFYAENNYSSGPLRNSKGLPLVEKIKNIIKSKVQ
ncbi:MAG TPA: hypothetical protein VFF33_08780 [Ignavibacteriaceae bacterium]|nr:hypothetical protein [Ignavibacteriaceae bacterium]